MEKGTTPLILTNTDIREIELVVPEGHRHLRTILRLQDGSEIILQEATVANLVRAYIDIKTHPIRTGITLVGRQLGEEERKEGFAGWQLLEGDEKGEG